MANERKLSAVVGFYDGPHEILEGMKKVKEANFRSIDAYTPFPVHGLEAAQGLKRSPLPWVTFFMGLTGCLAGFSLQYWTSAVDWPLIVGGKPFNSWPAFVPVMFELTILFGGVSTVLSLFAICRIPNMAKKTFDPGLTRDRFAIAIDADEKEASHGFKKFDENEAMDVLKRSGAKDVQKAFAEGWF